MKRKITAAILASSLLLGVTGCGNDKDVLKSSKKELDVVMTVGNFDVPMELYRYTALNIRDEYEQGASEDLWTGEDGVRLILQAEADVYETIARMYTPLVLAESYGIRTDDTHITESVNVRMDDIYESYEYDYKAYDAAISARHMNDGVYRFFVMNEVVSGALFDAMVLNGEIVTDETELLQMFLSADVLRVKQILVVPEVGETLEETRLRAEKILERAEAGEDFDALVRDYSKDLTMFNNPDGLYMMRGSYYKAFEDAAFSLKVGEISGVVETPAGFSIIKRYEKEEAYVRSHTEELTEQYYDSAYNLLLEEAYAGIAVEKTDLLAEYPMQKLK